MVPSTRVLTRTRTRSEERHQDNDRDQVDRAMSIMAEDTRRRSARTGLVSDSTNRHHDLRVFRVLFDFRAQPLHVDVH